MSTPTAERETTYIVIKQVTDGTLRANYHWDGRHHATHQEAVNAGTFNIGRIHDGELVWFGWMQTQLPGHDLSEIARQIGLNGMSDPKRYCGFRFPDGSGCVFGRDHTVTYHHSENGEDMPADQKNPAPMVPVEVAFRTKDGTLRRAVAYGEQLTDPSAMDLPAHDAWGSDGKGNGLKRASVPMATDILSDFQHSVSKIHGDDAVPLDIPDPERPTGKRPNPEWTFFVSRQVQDFGLAYLLLTLHELDPEVADSAAAFLADSWEAGDSLGEWAWEWHQAVLKGEPLNLPGIPQIGELFTSQVTS